MAPTLQDQDRLIVNKLAYRIGDPKVGDIVMLYYPLKPEKSFVKRIIAEEGDQVRIVDGRVFRNDVPLDDSFVPQDYRSHDDWGPQVIPEGYYFVMGDHRNNSSDSRHWGFVPKKYIIGKVQLRWWPMGHATVFWTQPGPPTRHQAVTRVLARVLVLNLAVAFVKLFLGYATGAVSIVSDGFQSLTDSASNVIGLVGMRAARKPPDADHPYGHRKFETLAAAGIFVFMLLAVLEIGRSALQHFAAAVPPDVTLLTFVVMIAHAGGQHRRRPLRGGARRGGTTASCCWPTRSTRAPTSTRRSACSSRWPACASAIPLLDPIGGIIIAVLIARTGFEIARDTSGILSDRVVIDEEDIRQVVMSVPGVLGCHHIRTPRPDRSRLPRPARLVPRRGAARRGAPACRTSSRIG